MTSIYDFKAITIKGEEMDFSQFKGKALLIVNTASKCGFTPQFTGLEELYQEYKERGLVVIGFPCNQFAHQDPSSNDEIGSFCQLNYGVSFPIMQKTDVNGEQAHPIFKYLKSRASGFLTNAIKWNFTKFLIAPDGQTIKRYAPITKPQKLKADIEKMLK